MGVAGCLKYCRYLLMHSESFWTYSPLIVLHLCFPSLILWHKLFCIHQEGSSGQLCLYSPWNHCFFCHPTKLLAHHHINTDFEEGVFLANMYIIITVPTQESSGFTSLTPAAQECSRGQHVHWIKRWTIHHNCSTIYQNNLTSDLQTPASGRLWWNSWKCA